MLNCLDKILTGMFTPNELKILSEKKNARLSSGILELWEANLLKFIPKNNIEITEENIKEFQKVMENSGLKKYGICICLNTPFFYTDEAINLLSKDKGLLGLAIVLKNKERILKNTIFVEMASMMPNPFKVPVKTFKEENYAFTWLKKIIRKKK